MSLGEKPTDRTSQPLNDVTEEELAAEINREHEAAEYNGKECLRHAHAAGVRLIEVKRRLAHGEFMPWVEQHCRFGHTSANQYMRVAREWEKIANSQSAENLTFSRALELLSTRLKEPDADLAARLADLGLIAWEDVEGLGPREASSFLNEVLRAYQDLCHEPDAALAAERLAKGGGELPYSIDRRGIRMQARRVAIALKAGAVRVKEIRRELRPLERCCRHDAPKGDRAAVRADLPSAASCRVRVTSDTPVAAYLRRSENYAAETRALLTQPYGLLNKRIVPDECERQQLRAQLTEVRAALDVLEEGMSQLLG